MPDSLEDFKSRKELYMPNSIDDFLDRNENPTEDELDSLETDAIVEDSITTQDLDWQFPDGPTEDPGQFTTPYDNMTDEQLMDHLEVPPRDRAALLQRVKDTFSGDWDGLSGDLRLDFIHDELHPSTEEELDRAAWEATQPDEPF